MAWLSRLFPDRVRFPLCGIAMSKWVVVMEWGEHVPGQLAQVQGSTPIGEKRKPATALAYAEKLQGLVARLEGHEFKRYWIVTPDGRKFSIAALRRMLAGPGKGGS